MLDWIAGLAELVGLVIVGNKNKFGFLVNIVGNILWTILAIKLHIYGLLLVVIPAIVINLRNWRKWSYEGNKLD